MTRADSPSASWQDQDERGNSLAFHLLVWVTQVLGRPAGRILLYPICVYFVVFSVHARRASNDYLRRVLGRRPTAGDTFRHCHTFASTIHDRVYLLAGRYEYFDVEVDAPAEVRQMLRQERGCILLGAHLGSFEILRAAGLAEGLPPVNMLMHVESTARLNKVLHALAPGIEERIIPLGRPESLLRVQECLARGEIVGILGDRLLNNERKCRCEFLGAPADFPLGPLLLAGLLEVPVVLMFGLYRGGRRYQIRLEPFAERIALEQRDRATLEQRDRATLEQRDRATLEQRDRSTLGPGTPLPRHRDDLLRPWVERYAARLEHHCRNAPYNWFNFYKFWPPRES